MSHTIKYLIFSLCSVLLVAAVAIFIVENWVDDDPIPRPRAMMRIDRVDSTLVEVDSLPLHPMVNSSARVTTVTDSTSSDGSHWFNIHYPHYNATIYCTYHTTTPSSITKHLDNRRHRIVLNAEDAQLNSAIFVDSLQRYSAEVFFASPHIPTPVQFLTTDSTSFIFTGALFLKDNSNPDSIAPVVDYITDDIMTMLQNLKVPLSQ